MDDRFLGAPLEAVTAIGKIVVAAARLEGVVHDILQDLAGSASRGQVDTVLKEVRRAAGNQLPAHARITAEELVDWTERAGQVMRERHQLPHSVVLSVFVDGEWVPHAQHIRSRSMAQLDASLLADLADRLAALAAEGYEVHHRLLRQPADRVYVRNMIRQGEPWVLIAHAEDSDFPRPTDIEVNEWLMRFPPQVIPPDP